jgi:hypothetical protein
MGSNPSQAATQQTLLQQQQQLEQQQRRPPAGPSTLAAGGGVKQGGQQVAASTAAGGPAAGAAAGPASPSAAWESKAEAMQLAPMLLVSLCDATISTCALQPGSSASVTSRSNSLGVVREVRPACVRACLGDD